MVFVQYAEKGYLITKNQVYSMDFSNNLKARLRVGIQKKGLLNHHLETRV